MKKIILVLMIIVGVHPVILPITTQWGNEQRNNQQNQETDNCPICLEEIEHSPSDSVCAPCPNGHAFHLRCYQEFSENSNANRCPICRASLEGSSSSIETPHIQTPTTFRRHENQQRHDSQRQSFEIRSNKKKVAYGMCLIAAGIGFYFIPRIRSSVIDIMSSYANLYNRLINYYFKFDVKSATNVFSNFIELNKTGFFSNS